MLVGDEDEGCLEPALMLKRTIPTAGLAVLPRTGHTANLEEPDVFNRAVDISWPRGPRRLAPPRPPVPLRLHHRHELTALDWQLRSGRWRRLHHGVYATFTGDRRERRNCGPRCSA